MKHLLIATGLAVGLTMQPAFAEDMDASLPDPAAKSAEKANTPETLHAPTNRVGEMVPTMSSPENKDLPDAAAEGAKKANTPETLHAPTNRVGDQVPTMRSDENPDG